MNIKRKEYQKLYIIDKIKKFVAHIQKELKMHWLLKFPKILNFSF